VSKLPLPDLGAYLREQREHAQLSLRQLADLAGISNPYLSQIERGLKRPSAEILQQIAKGLQVSAESLYVRAGILDERITHDDPSTSGSVLAAIAADPALTDRQRGVLVEIYLSFVGEEVPATPATAHAASSEAPTTRRQGTPSRRRRPSPVQPAGANLTITDAPDDVPSDTTDIDTDSKTGTNTDIKTDVTTDLTTEITPDVEEKEN
jgi:transcriptional regulator with XRE-family HTH domain